MEIRNNGLMQNKLFPWLAFGTGFTLLIPLIAMQFTDEVNWALGDFVVMGTLLFGMGTLFLFVASKIDKKYQIALGAAFVLASLWLWAELAVGVFTNWGS